MLLFSCEYGSRAMGMGTVDSDHDIMEVHLEPREYITGLKTWDAKHHSTAGNGRSGAGDTDTTVYGLRHWASLAAKGNPTAMTPLFVRADALPLVTGTGGESVAGDYRGWLLGGRILARAHLFISKEAGRRYKGYSFGQRQALTGMRNKRTNRPELVHKHGYDTKFAYHMIRTAMQGIELMHEGWIELPIRDERGMYLREIRNGEISREEVLEFSDQLDRELEQAIDDSDLPETADYDSINELLHDIYLEGWNS